MSQEPDELESSLKALGQIEPIIRCGIDNNIILSGNTRFKKLNKLGKRSNATLYACAAKMKELGISHDLLHEMVIDSANIRREHTREEREESFAKMASILQKEGVEPGKCAGVIAKVNGLGEDWVRKVLPSEYKRQYTKPEETGLSPELQEAEKQRFSEDASKHRISTFTQSEEVLGSAFSYYGLHPDLNWRNPDFKTGEVTKDGKEKGYVPDFHFTEIGLTVEPFGKGSSTIDNPKRATLFEEKGVFVWAIPNEMAIKYNDEIAQIVSFMLKRLNGRKHEY